MILQLACNNHRIALMIAEEAPKYRNVSACVFGIEGLVALEGDPVAISSLTEEYNCVITKITPREEKAKPTAAVRRAYLELFGILPHGKKRYQAKKEKPVIRSVCFMSDPPHLNCKHNLIWKRGKH